MMKVGVLTFQFAHNYGAMLQAFALKRFLQNAGFDAEVISYYPKWAQNEYAISPFSRNISYRKKIRLAIQFVNRNRTAKKFDDFRKTYLTGNSPFDSYEELMNCLNAYDCIIFGSDQIWNDHITGRNPDYYGGDTIAKRISYAASLGTKELTEWQTSCAEKYLSRFAFISVREPNSVPLLEPIVHKPISTVLDPVFLISEEEWKSEAASIDVDNQFMFLYLLKDDEELLKKCRKYADENKLVIYEIHPTLARFHAGCKKLIDAGPREFLWLIQNAQCVCTNSFHATSFSMIFGKKLLHIPNKNSPERTISLLNRMGYQLIQENANFPLYDLSGREQPKLESLVMDSKRFLLEALERLE